MVYDYDLVPSASGHGGCCDSGVDAATLLALLAGNVLNKKIGQGL